MQATIQRLCRYPVKGLTAEDLEQVNVTAGRALPGDRRFAIARGSSGVPATPEGWVSWEHFITLRRCEQLAQLDARFDPDSGVLAIDRKGKTVCQGKVTEPIGRALVEQFLAAFLKDEVSSPPKLVDGGETAMTDSDDPEISFINLASVRDLERVVGQPVDPLRFRANVYLEGLDPWVEMQWVGQTLEAGALRLEVSEPIERCAATTVNPDTARRDVNIPKLLQRGYNHICMGIYAIPQSDGTLRVGDTIEVP